MVKTKSILLTGATGLLGRHLVASLLEDGYTIKATKRDSSKTFSHPNLSWLSFEELFNQKDLQVSHIIHAAGLVSYREEDKRRLFEVNQKLTKELGEWALSQKVEKFIYISSIATIGKDKTSNILTEESRWNQDQFASQYALSKKGGENEIKKLGLKGLNYIILNPSVIIGSSPLENSSSQLFKYVLDEKPFYTSGIINYIDVRDVVGAIKASIKSTLVNEQFILNAGYISYKNFFSKIAEELMRRPPFICIPRFAVLLGATLEGLWSKLNRKEALLSKDSAKTAGNTYIYSSDKIKNQMSIHFKPFEETISYTINMMRKEGFIKL